MKSLFKNIFSFFLLGIFLFPNFVQFFHHHEEEVFVCTAKGEKHIHIQHDKCEIEAFHYAPFSLDILKIEFGKELTVYYKNTFLREVIYTSASPYSFQLRAPPVQV